MKNSRLEVPLQLLVVGVGVVVGNRQEVETQLDGVADKLLDRIQAVRVQGVTVQVALQPAPGDASVAAAFGVLLGLRGVARHLLR